MFVLRSPHDIKLEALCALHKQKAIALWTCTYTYLISSVSALTIPIFLKYNILKINDMVDFNQATFMFKYTNARLPDSFENRFNKLGNFDRSLSSQVDLLNFISFLHTT